MKEGKSMAKYEFKKNGVDDYTLKYKDKEINFNSNVGIVNRFQNIVAEAKKEMMFDCIKKGIKPDDLVVKKVENGKTYYDNKMKEELEQIYIQEAQGQVFLDAIKELFGMEAVELFLEIGLETAEETTQFANEIGNILVGKYETP